MRTIAALVPNKLGVSPGQRLRIEAWSKFLLEYGWKIDFYPFEDQRLHEIFYSQGRYVSKMVRMTSCYFRQLQTVLNGIECDGLFIYREAALIGPSFLERLAKRLKVPIIYDIDDPVFLPYKSPVNGWMSLLKFSRKTHTLFKICDRVISINDLIGDYARKFNSSVSIVPNFIDTDVYHPAKRSVEDFPKIVWTGSVSTLQNLKTVAEPLRRLQANYDLRIRIVANGTIDIDGVELENKEWTPEAEVQNLQECDIGIVPLLDLEWNPWKFYLKTVQYMGAGLPVVARRIGSNTQVIQDGKNGFLVETEEEWYQRLKLLIDDADLRREMGVEARRTAVENYSINCQKGRVAKIFDEVYGG